MRNTGVEYASTDRSPVVLPEMAGLLPPLTGEQLSALEADLLANGCYSPIIVNEDMVIVDGHHRHGLCEKHGLPYKMAVFSFPDLLEAKQWALDTQKGRRNLDKWELGKIALTLNDPYHRKKWSLFTWRYSCDSPEYDCADVRPLIRYINRIGPELDQDVTPPFVGERRAVEVYAHKRRGEPWGIPVYRNGEHCYTYQSRQDGKEHPVIVTPDLTAPCPALSQTGRSPSRIYTSLARSA